MVVEGMIEALIAVRSPKGVRMGTRTNTSWSDNKNNRTIE